MSLYFDCETIGLYGRVVLVQIFDDATGELQVLRPDIDAPLWHIKKMLQQADHVVAHNAIYDFTVLDLDPDTVNWDDTFLLSKLHWPSLDSYALDKVITKVLGHDPYEAAGIDKKAMQKADWSGKLTEKQIEYASIDVRELPKVYAAVKDQVGHIDYKLDKATIRNFWAMKSGLPVLRDKMENRLQENKQKMKELNVPINVNSFRQVRQYLQWDESNDEALAYLIVKGDSDQRDKAARVREVRRLRKQNSFIEKYLKLSEQDGYIYGHLNVGTVSGRSNCSNENLQQVPSSLKDCFGSTDKYMVYADFSNLELRTFCAVVGERTISKLLREDVDLHTYTATKLFNCSTEEVTKLQRQIAKVYNFSSLYGAGVERRRQILLKLTGIFIEEDEARRYARAWQRAFPQVKQWHEENARKWRSGQVEYTILGRPYKAKLFTDYNNVRISGTAAEIAKLAMNYMAKRIDMKHMLMYIHDSYTLEFDTYEEAKKAAYIVGQSMKDAWFEVTQYCAIKDVPMPTAVSIAEPGVNWHDTQEGINCEVIKFKGGKDETNDMGTC